MPQNTENRNIEKVTTHKENLIDNQIEEKYRTLVEENKMLQRERLCHKQYIQQQKKVISKQINIIEKQDMEIADFENKENITNAYIESLIEKIQQLMPKTSWSLTNLFSDDMFNKLIGI